MLYTYLQGKSIALCRCEEKDYKYEILYLENNISDIVFDVSF